MAGLGRTTAKERRVLTIALVAGAACVAQAFGRFTFGVVLPDVRDGVLGGSNTIAGLFGTLNLAAYLAGTLLIASMSTTFTLVDLTRAGLVVSTSGLALASITTSGPYIAVALMLMGLGGAAIWIPAPSLATSVLPPHRPGLGIGLIATGIGLGVVLAGQMTAVLRRAGDVDDVWQAVYRIELAIAVVVLICVFAFLRADGPRPAGRGGLAGLGALRTVRAWRPLTIAYGAFGFSYILANAFFVARLVDDAGFSPDQAAAMFSVIGGATVFGGLLLGPLSDRIGRRATLVGAFTLAASFTLLGLANRQPWVRIAAIGQGLTSLGIPSMISAHVIAYSNAVTYGPAFSAVTLSFGLTQMVAPQLGGALADALGSFTLVFVLSAAVGLVGAAASTRLPGDDVPGGPQAGPSSPPPPLALPTTHIAKNCDPPP